MVKSPKRALLGASWLGVVVLAGGAITATNCVVYTPELLDEDAVSLGRATPTSTSSPASPALRDLRSQSFNKDTSSTPALHFVVTPAASTAPLEAEQGHRTETGVTAQGDGCVSDAGSDAEVCAAAL